MLNEFKSFTAARMDLDDLVALAAFGRRLREEYEAQKVEEPEFPDSGPFVAQEAAAGYSP